MLNSHARLTRERKNLFARDNFRIALVIPRQGPAGMFAPSCEAVVELAAGQLNASAGIAGRHVEVEVFDSGDDPAVVASRVGRAIRAGQIHGITGWHTSAVRRALVPRLDGSVPYVYTSLYEGGERSPDVYCAGETPYMQIAPALRWLQQHQGVRRWCIVGADYVWPRSTARAIAAYCQQLGLEIVGERFVPYGGDEFGDTARWAVRTGADGILMLMVGQDAVAFSREFADLPGAARMVRFTPLMEENMVLAAGADAADGLFVSAGYFTTLATAGALDLMGAYAARFGPDAPVLNNVAESCYEGLLALASLMPGGSSGLPGYDGPRGSMVLGRGHFDQHVYLARVTNLDFDILDMIHHPGARRFG